MDKDRNDPSNKDSIVRKKVIEAVQITLIRKVIHTKAIIPWIMMENLNNYSRRNNDNNNIEVYIYSINNNLTNNKGKFRIRRKIIITVATKQQIMW